jgi:hypothetical protein
VALVGRSATAHAAAAGLVQGSPLRAVLEARGAGVVETRTAAAEQALAARVGHAPLEAPMAAILVTARR